MQKDDLARMYRLFSRIPKGLDPVADAFKRHVESEGSRLVKEVTEAANQKKEAGTKAFCSTHSFSLPHKKRSKCLAYIPCIILEICSNITFPLSGLPGLQEC